MTNWIIGGIIALAIVGGGFLMFNTGSDSMMQENETMNKDAMKESEKMMETNNDVMMQETNPAMENKDAMMKGDAMKEDGTMQKEEGVMQKGSYEPYAAAKLAKAATGDVVLFFRASWCPTCKALDSDIRAHLSQIPGTLTILDVNYDTETALKQKYAVTYQHTLVQVDVSGKQITKWSGGQTLASIIEKVQ